MSSTVDSRIVTMKFENSTFERGVSATLNTLNKLKGSLNFSTSTKGLNDLQTAGNRFNLNGIDGAVSGVSNKFIAMSAIAVTALATITNKAIDAGLSFAKSFTTDPINAGLKEYETNLNSIQTILANTQSSGATLQDVNSALAELNRYSDKTIYNFSEMARNIGTFTAAGVDLKTSTAAIKGIANLAALSGSNSQQASTAMYQLSQGLSAGVIHLQDWNSVVNAGMGGTVFQRALAETAVKLGTLEDSAVTLKGKMKNVSIEGNSFRNSLTPPPGGTSWLTSKVLTSTLQQFTGDLTDADLAAQGFSKSQIMAIQAQAKSAQDAATKVKTLSQVIDVAKETAGSGWAKTWQLVFGDFEEARSTFTNISNAVNGFINTSANARNKVLGDWKKLGGRTVLIEGIGKAFDSVLDVLSPIKKAFRDIFPAMTGKKLYALTVAFRDFAEGMSLNEGTMDNLRRTFRGVFAVLDIGWQVVKGIIGVFGDMFSAAGEASGGLLGLTGDVGDFLVKLDESIKKGGKLTDFFGKMGAILSIPIKALGSLDEALAHISDGVTKLWNKIHPSIMAIGGAFEGLGHAIAGAFSTGNFDTVLNLLKVGLLGGIILLVKKFFTKILNLDFGHGIISGIRDSFGTLTDTMKSMQTQIQAKTLLLIAGAIALLTASVVALSLINPEKLTKALAAMAVGFGQLLGAMAILVKISGSAGFVKVPLIAASMVLLSGSILILTAAIAAMGQLDWKTIGKGLAGIAGVLTVIGAAMRLMPKGMTLQAAALVLIGVALNEITLAVAAMSLMSWKKIGKGLAGIGAALVVVAAAIALMPKSMILQAIGLKIIGKALLYISAAVAVMSLMSWKQMAHGLVALAGALVIIAGGLYLMSGTLAGSAALLVAAGALAILTPVLVTLGTLSWEMIAKGLLALAGAFVVIGLAGLVLTPIVPSLLGLSVAIVLLGAGMALAGIGALAFATAFTIVVGAMAAAVDSMKLFLNGLLDTIIQLAPKIGEAFLALVLTAIHVLVQAVPKLVAAGFKLLMSILNGVRDHIGEIVTVVGEIITKFINALGDQLHDLVDAGIKFIIKFINAVADGIRNNARDITDACFNLASALVSAIAVGIQESGHLIKEALQNAIGDAIKDLPGDALGGLVNLGGAVLGPAGQMGGNLIDNITPRTVASATSTSVNDNVRNFGPSWNAVKKTVQALNGVVNDMFDSSPVIAPVLDLTQVQREARNLGSIINPRTLKAGVSFGRASTISTDQQAAKGIIDVIPDVTPKEVKFEQNNYSPKALSAREIYLNTRNQISFAKEALKAS